MFNRNQLAIIAVGLLLLVWIFTTYEETKTSIKLMNTIEIVYNEPSKWNPKGFSLYPVPQKEEIQKNALKEAEKEFAFAGVMAIIITLILVLLSSNSSIASNARKEAPPCAN